MNSETLRGALEHVGLTSYQADAYLTLLELGLSPAVELARNCSVPVSQIYDVLRELEERGYVETMEHEKLYAQPKEPEEMLSDLTDRGELLVDAASAVEERYQRPNRMDARLSLTNKTETVTSHAAEFVEEASSLVELATTAEQLRAFLPALREARDRGAFVRVTLYDEEMAYEGFDIDPEGAINELRVCPIPGPFLVIVDRRRACFAPNADTDEDYGVLIHDRILPFIFHWYFLTCLWNLFPSVYVDDPYDVVYVSLEEFVRDYLDLWEEGYELVVEVTGVEIASDRERTVVGRVSDIVYWWTPERESPRALSRLAALIAIVVDTGDEEVSVGGWGAVLEEIEMRRIQLVGLHPPEL